MEKSQSLTLEIFTNEPAQGNLTVHVSSVISLLSAIQPKSIDRVVTSSPLPSSYLLSADFWRLLHASLKEKSEAILKHGADLTLA
jgi:hypothetical protein